MTAPDEEQESPSIAGMKKELDDVPVEFVYDSDGGGYWLVRHEGPSGNDGHVPSRQEIEEVEEMRKNEPEKYKEYVKGRKLDYYYTFEKPWTLQCRKCGCTFPCPPRRDRSVPYKVVEVYDFPAVCPESLGGCGRTLSSVGGFDVVTPKPPEGNWQPIRINQQLEQLKNEKIDNHNYNIVEDKTTILGMFGIISKIIVFPSDAEAKIFGLSIIASWKIDSFDEIGYLGLWGERDSGKSQALRLLGELAYHAIPLATITVAALARAIEKYNASLLVDEVHDHLGPKNPDANKLRGILKTGFMKGFKYTICKENSDDIVGRNVFGFKAFTGRYPFKGSLYRRCINIFMEEHTPEIDEMEEVKDRLSEIRTALLAYRLLMPDPPKLEFKDYTTEVNGTTFKLKGGTLQVFRPILRVAKQFNIPTDPIVKYAYQQYVRYKEEMLVSEEASVIFYIYKNQQGGVHEISLSEIAYQCEILGKSGKPSPTRVGYMLKGMDLKTDRTSGGTVLRTTKKQNEKKLAYLYQKYETKYVEREEQNDVSYETLL